MNHNIPTTTVAPADESENTFTDSVQTDQANADLSEITKIEYNAQAEHVHTLGKSVLNNSVELKGVAFDPMKSPLANLYKDFDVTTPLTLMNKIDELDQELMVSREWDYRNDSLLLNQITKQLEAIDATALSEDEREIRNELLWFWNHHATSKALFGYRDDAAARQFANTALSYQADGHPNKITKILRILADGDIVGAEIFAKTEVSDNEQAAAADAIQTYRQTHGL